ncbi:molybdate ABC transporter substrate-binding protein [Arthrobacter caoxuetaonis]|uniref:molybdate ABC transporter substrate-binding protein n=1 Tax=Arthrobacter caoxuetaonis TaxID=2886935 RepID=UPI001D13D9BF|nr:molybdate ABC transporter substrate-binding protein [Arthrobacter caoxuetaonis]MCC3283549.1 molybdate ABC transporter substrate-binding protein [Arthrobacter caoxuetaonis]
MPERFSRAGFLVPALAAVLALGACADTTPAAGRGGELTVFAAASLSRPFTELAQDFEAAHPGTTVRLNFAGSSDLAAQLVAGAPADVFAAADETNMARVLEADLAAGEPADFAANTLTIAVPPGNPAGITGFGDLAAPGVQVVMCAVQVPCGAAAERIEAASGTALSPVSEESSVAGVLGKVSSGEADAGLVYVTDVKAAGSSVEEVPLPEAADAVNRYPIVRLSGSGNSVGNSDAADAFIQYVVGSQGQSVLRGAGFGAP